MKRTPLLEFTVDPAVVAGSRVEEVLRRIRDVPRQRRRSGRRWHRRRPDGPAPAPDDEPGRARSGHRTGGGGQGGRLDLPRRGGPVPPDLRPAPGGPRRHAGPRRHRGAAGRAGPGHPPACASSPRLPKTYEAEVVLGTATSTLDASGEVTGTWDMDGMSLAEVRAAAVALTGPIEQVPPMVSAVKVGGQRLHALARAGIEVERAARPVTVYRFDVHPGMTPGVFRIEVECSSGTYVRVLAADLGRCAGRRRPPPEPAADPDRLVLDRGGPPGRRADPGGGAHPGPGAAGPRPGGGARRGPDHWWPAAWPSTGCRWGSPATVPGAWSTRGTACWPSTRPPRPTGSGPPWCSSRPDEAGSRGRPAPAAAAAAVTFPGDGDRDRPVELRRPRPGGAR